MSSLTGRVVVVTGASSGIGEATARRLAERGASVVLGARREERLRSLAAALGPQAAWRRTDVGSLHDVEGLAAHAVAQFGGFDAWINNAGIMPLSLLEEGRVVDWDRMIDVNFKGVLYGIRAALGHMLPRSRGHIVNVGSVASWRVLPTGAVYAATKFAVRALTDGLRQETAGKLKVTMVCPGAVDTELPDAVPDEARKLEIRRAFGEFALPPQAIADAIVYALEQPEDVAINEIVIRPQHGPQS